MSKRHARVEINDRVEVVDTNSANGVVVGGVRVPRVAIGAGDVVQVGDSFLTVTRTVPMTRAASTTDIEYVRSPRVLARRAETKVDMPSPPREVDPNRFPWISMVAPLVMGGVMFAATKSPMSLAFVALSPLLMVGNWINQRSERKIKNLSLIHI